MKMIRRWIERRHERHYQRCAAYLAQQVRAHAVTSLDGRPL